MPKTKTYSTATIKNVGKSRVEITGSIAAEIWEKYRDEALQHINEAISVDGFRKGMVPENILLGKVGEMAILEEMAEHAVPPAYVDIIIDNKIDAIGRPEIHITKLAKGNDLEFKMTTTVVPTVSLPDYKKIAKDLVEKKSTDYSYTDKEFEDAVTQIRMSHAQITAQKIGGKAEDVKKENLPELTDEIVQNIGSGFTSVDDFNVKVGEMLTDQKKEESKEKLRITIADAISEVSQIEVPDLLIESEINRIEAQFASDIERMGVKLDDYLKHAKKTVEDLHKEWREPAEKKAKLQLIINAIAQKENIVPAKEEIEKEVSHILEHYADADREKAAAYAETVLTNEQVFQFLETQK